MKMLSKSLKSNHVSFCIDTDLDNVIKVACGSIKILDDKINVNENYIHDMGKYIILITDRNTLITRHKNSKLIFKKSKIYKLPKQNDRGDIILCEDEFETEFNMKDVWWDSFYFLTEGDLLKLERKFKLDEIENK